MASNRLCAAVTAALLMGLAGCGQKGPLYLPDKGGEVVTRPGGQTPTPPPPQSSETAPQPSTQPQTNTTESEKKNPPPPR
jgi:predicted small lipoprotein YifL